MFKFELLRFSMWKLGTAKSFNSYLYFCDFYNLISYVNKSKNTRRLDIGHKGCIFWLRMFTTYLFIMRHLFFAFFLDAFKIVFIILDDIYKLYLYLLNMC